MIGISSLSRNYLRNRSTALMTDACVITKPGVGKVSYDPVTRKAAVSGGSERYAGECRLWQVGSGGSSWVQDKELTSTTTYLSIPYGEVTEPNDIVTVTASDDPSLVGRSLRVDAVTRGGGLRGSRVMRVTFIDREEDGNL